MALQNNDRLVAILFGVFCIGGLIACATSPPYDAIPAPVTQASGNAEFGKLLNSIRIEERLPGLAAAIIIDGKLHTAAAVGIRETDTNNWLTINDKFLIGSFAKAFTATLAAILVEEGRLSWQTTIRDVFPDLNMLPEYGNITIQQLLSHQAGLPKNLKGGKATWLIDYGFDEKRGKPSKPSIKRITPCQEKSSQRLNSSPSWTLLSPYALVSTRLGPPSCHSFWVPPGQRGQQRPAWISWEREGSPPHVQAAPG